MSQKKVITSTKTLLKDRSVFLFGEVNEQLAFSIIRNIRYLIKQGPEPIKIFIHSDGGCIDAGAAIIDEMQLAKDSGIVIKTIVQGKAYSYAAFIAAMGTKDERYGTENSSIMIHEASFEAPSDYLGKQEEYTNFIKKQWDTVLHLVATACKKGGKKFTVFQKDVEKSLWLNTKDAIKYGLLDKIWDSTCN